MEDGVSASFSVESVLSFHLPVCPGIQVRFSGLAAHTFTHWAILPAFFLLNVLKSRRRLTSTPLPQPLLGNALETEWRLAGDVLSWAGWSQVLSMWPAGKPLCPPCAGSAVSKHQLGESHCTYNMAVFQATHAVPSIAGAQL